MPRTRDQRCQRVINLFFNRQLPNTHFQLSKVDGRGWKIARYKVIISSRGLYEVLIMTMKQEH